MSRGTVSTRPRQRAGLGLFVLSVISVGLLLVPLVSSGVLAASVEPVTSLQDARLAGNPTCSEIDDWYGGGQTWTGSKIEGQPETGTYSFGEGRTVTITSWDPATMTFDWASTFGIDAVFIKAGQGGEDAANTLYVYAPTAMSPESFGDTDLVSLGARGVSHVEFCWDAGAPPSPSPASPSPASPSPASPSPSPASPSPSLEASTAPSGAPASPSPSPASPSPSLEASVGPASSSEVSPSPTGEVLDIAVTPPPTDQGHGAGLPDPAVSWVSLLAIALAIVSSVAIVVARRAGRFG